MKKMIVMCNKREAELIWELWKIRCKKTYKRLISKQCESCGSNILKSIHHKNGDKRTNSISNLMTLYNKCHFQIHKTTLQINYLDTHKGKNYWLVKTLLFEDKIIIEKMREHYHNLKLEIK